MGLCAGVGCGIVNTAYNLIQSINPIGTANAAGVVGDEQALAEATGAAARDLLARQALSLSVPMWNLGSLRSALLDSMTRAD